MKKIALLVFALILSASALAEIDLSGMTYDELVALKDQINLAIWNSEEWQEVTVPQGRWIVGEDIPAGKWTVKCATMSVDSAALSFAIVTYGERLDDDNDISSSGRYDTFVVHNAYHDFYEKGKVTHVTIDLYDGDIVDIDTGYAPVVFMPYSGKPILGFK